MTLATALQVLLPSPVVLTGGMLNDRPFHFLGSHRDLRAPGACLYAHLPATPPPDVAHVDAVAFVAAQAAAGQALSNHTMLGEDAVGRMLASCWPKVELGGTGLRPTPAVIQIDVCGFYGTPGRPWWRILTFPVHVRRPRDQIQPAAEVLVSVIRSLSRKEG